MNRARVLGVEVLAGLALDEDRIGAELQDLTHPEHVGLDQVLERGDKGEVAAQLLIPSAVLG